MTIWLELLEPLARTAIAALFNSLWQALVLVVPVWGLFRLSRRTTARTRYGIWSFILAVVVLLPFLALGSLIYSPERAQIPVVLKQVSYQKQCPPLWAASVVVKVPEKVSATSGAPDPVDFWAILFPVQLLPGQWPLLLFGLWSMVFLGMCARIFWSYVYLNRLQQRSRKLPVPGLARLRPWLADTRRSVRLGASREVPLPVVVGLVHPVILFPERMLEQLSEAELERIMLHALAHLERWDNWAHLGQKLVEAMFFFHPVVLWVARQLHLERERACDDWVTAMTGQAHPLAHCLTRWVELTTFPYHPLLTPP
ncbi:M56 family metallopeptidase [Anthocerotibacter panamensis]|uniref:M56 family metallopeptidase n=1 Tax=Anthocerotibacter panamensis TaxID=2857077 RepID=UPI001C40242B|nr:M56 family metallopeptidase [Anthocerotibacter panamensis]